MSKIYYYNYHLSQVTEKKESHSLDEPIPFNYDKTGKFSDCIYHSRNSGARFYVVVFGYEKGWYHPPQQAKTNRYIMHFILDGKGVCDKP